jgi:hypothetical protein
MLGLGPVGMLLNLLALVSCGSYKFRYHGLSHGHQPGLWSICSGAWLTESVGFGPGEAGRRAAGHPGFAAASWRSAGFPKLRACGADR